MLKKTAFRKLQEVKKKNCAGKATAAELTKAANDYIKDAVAKGKTKTEATKSATRVKNSGCAISGVKKRTTKRTAKKK